MYIYSYSSNGSNRILHPFYKNLLSILIFDYHKRLILYNSINKTLTDTFVQKQKKFHV